MDTKAISTLLVLLQDNRMTKLMQAADLFDKGKVIAALHEVTIDYTNSISLEEVGKSMSTLVEAFNKVNTEVVLLHLLYIQAGNTVILNDSILPYYKKGVRQVSNGHKLYMLDDFVRELGLVPKVSQFRYIEEVSFPVS